MVVGEKPSSRGLPCLPYIRSSQGYLVWVRQSASARSLASLDRVLLAVARLSLLVLPG